MNEEQFRMKSKATAAWIVVLAIAITCCALLFVVFANYLVAINGNLSIANQRLTVMEDNEIQMLHEIQAMHHSMAANAPATPPAEAPAPASTPAPAAAAPAPAPATTPPAPPSATPSPASKTTVPEMAPTTH